MRTKLNPFHGCAQRTFRRAMVHVLEKEYGLLGSRLVLELLAEDVEHLIMAHYPRHAAHA